MQHVQSRVSEQTSHSMTHTRTLRAEEQLTVRTAILSIVLHLDTLESIANSAGALIGS